MPLGPAAVARPANARPKIPWTPKIIYGGGPGGRPLKLTYRKMGSGVICWVKSSEQPPPLRCPKALALPPPPPPPTAAAPPTEPWAAPRGRSRSRRRPHGQPAAPTGDPAALPAQPARPLVPFGFGLCHPPWMCWPPYEHARAAGLLTAGEACGAPPSPGSSSVGSAGGGSTSPSPCSSSRRSHRGGSPSSVSTPASPRPGAGGEEAAASAPALAAPAPAGQPPGAPGHAWRRRQRLKEQRLLSGRGHGADEAAAAAAPAAATAAIAAAAGPGAPGAAACAEPAEQQLSACEPPCFPQAVWGGPAPWARTWPMWGMCTVPPPPPMPPPPPLGAKGLPPGVEFRSRMAPEKPMAFEKKPTAFEKDLTWWEGKSRVTLGKLHFIREFCHLEGGSVAEKPPERYREVYIVNLQDAEQVGPKELADAFDNMFSMLPEFHQRYPHVSFAVDRVKIGESRVSAFVQFSDAVLASTAIQMTFIRVRGRPLTVARPRCYEAPKGGEAIALDVSPLRQLGLLPSQDDMRAGCRASLRRRQLYIGGLKEPGVTKKELQELLDYICINLPEYSPAAGSAVLDVATFDNKYAFAELQSEQLAGAALSALTNVVIRGHSLHVMVKKSIYRNAPG